MFLNFILYYFNIYILTYYIINNKYNIPFYKFLNSFLITLCSYHIFNTNILIAHILLIFLSSIYIGLNKNSIYFFTLSASIISLIIFIIKFFLCHYLSIELSIRLSYIISTVCVYPIYIMLTRLQSFFNVTVSYLYPIIYLIFTLFLSIYNSLNNKISGIYLSQLMTIMFITIMIVIYIILISIKIFKDQKKELTKKELADLMNYVSAIDESYNKLRHFKHDFNNIMLTLDSYIYNNDFKGLKQYYYSLNEYIHNELQVSSNNKDKLSYIENIPLKSLLISKISLAMKQNINIELSANQKINIKESKTINICRIVGILLDNAIEEVNQLNDDKKKNITVIFSNSNESTLIKIINPFRKDHNPIIFANSNTSNKGKDHGLGLKEIRYITKCDKTISFCFQQDNDNIEASILLKER